MNRILVTRRTANSVGVLISIGLLVVVSLLTEPPPLLLETAKESA